MPFFQYDFASSDVMRVLFLSLFVFFLFNISVGQGGHSIVDTTNVWSEVRRSWNSSRTQYLKIGRDTVLEEIKYSQIIEYRDSLFSNGFYIGAMREQEGKVYFRGPDREILLYDFTLDVGDTFSLENVPKLDLKFVVESIDTILVAGSLRRVFNFDEGYHKWVEGIGSNYGGLLYPFMTEYVADLGIELLCLKSNGIVQYQNPEYNSCFLDSYTSTQSVKKVEIHCYPNPTNQGVTVELSQNFLDGQISIHTIDGRQIYKTTIESASVQIPHHLFPIAGVYMLNLKTPKSSIHKTIVVY